MAVIELRLCLHVDCRQAEPEARAFIDLRPDVRLGSERELPLRRRGRHEWIGSFVIGEASPRYFLYRVALAAHEGAIWELTFRERRTGATLLADADTFEIAKCWLVGSCECPKVSKSARACSPGKGTNGYRLAERDDRGA